MSAFRKESEEHIVHRLEAFSDIVIGFSLAQMTLNLALPPDVLDLFAKHSPTLAAFALTFSVVSGMWWSHHRLFANYFVPTRLNLILNFCSLGGVMFLVYSLQVWLHAQYHQQVAFTMYTAAIAWVVGINGFLTYRGVALRGDRMDPHLVQLGRRRALHQVGIAVVFAGLAVSSALSRPAAGIQGWAMLAAVLILIALRVIDRRRPIQNTNPVAGQ